MNIAPGTRLGPFDVVDLIGAGGMGAVYRAHDPRLRRDVAIKVVTADCLGDPTRLRRFEQEALAVARLAHPNIVAVHDVGSHEGSPYIVMELLEGGTLREKMSGRPLPLAQSRRVCKADRPRAGGRARAGHRAPRHQARERVGDPGRTDQGSRFRDRPRHGCRRGAAETAVTLTGLGPIGTAGYMSPEQARGARADHRADLFSLGVVLYEMISGISPFRRETAPETMTAILREPPPELPDPVACPPALRRLLWHCLEKDPGERFQSARDLVYNLDAASDATSLPAPDGGRRLPIRRRSVLIAAIALALVGAAGVLRRAADRRTGRAAPGEPHLPLHRFQRAGGVSGDCTGPEIGRVHGARQRIQAGLRSPRGRRAAAAGHQGCRRPRAASLVARLELAHLLLAGSARRYAGHHLEHPRSRRGGTAGRRQRRRRRYRSRRPDCQLQSLRRPD